MLKLKVESWLMTDLFYDQSTVWVKINQDYGRDYESLDKVTNSKIEELQSLLDPESNARVTEFEWELWLTKEKLATEEVRVKTIREEKMTQISKMS